MDVEQVHVCQPQLQNRTGNTGPGELWQGGGHVTGCASGSAVSNLVVKPPYEWRGGHPMSNRFPPRKSASHDRWTHA